MLALAIAVTLSNVFFFDPFAGTSKAECQLEIILLPTHTLDLGNFLSSVSYSLGN